MLGQLSDDIIIAHVERCIDGVLTLDGMIDEWAVTLSKRDIYFNIPVRGRGFRRGVLALGHDGNLKGTY